MIDLIINYYKAKESLVHQKTTLGEVLESIRNGNSNLDKVDRRGICYSSVSVYGRKHIHIGNYTGLMFMDVDSCIRPDDVKEFFMNLEHTVATWYSFSGNVHAIIKIPVCLDKDEFRRRFQRFFDLVKPLITGGEVDPITKNPTQLSFESFDKDIYVNYDAVAFPDIYPEVVRKVVLSKKGEEVSRRQEKWTVDWITKRVNEITNNGYPQVLALSYTLGGYCSGGYINEGVALNTLNEVIADNGYLNSGDSQGSIEQYLMYAEGSFEAGLNNPIEWEDK